MSIHHHLNIPSPEHSIHTAWTKAAGIYLSVKRDDLIHPIISGNKWRKLSGIFAHYTTNQYSQLVTYGGAFSNHLVATAAACAILGIPCKGIVRGDEPKEINPVLKLCILYGMELQFVSRATYKETNRISGIRDGVLHIPEGGACAQGATGCSQLLKEVDLNSYDKVFVACGTGTTLAGMATHLKNQTSPTLFGVQVLKGKSYIANELKMIYGIDHVPVYDTFHLGGYAKTTDELISFIHDFNRETGVLLDPIYTGKLFLALKKLCENGEIKKNERILAVHTGGLTGWFGKANSLAI